jgi:hypothetical protein
VTSMRTVTALVLSICASACVQNHVSARPSTGSLPTVSAVAPVRRFELAVLDPYDLNDRAFLIAALKQVADSVDLTSFIWLPVSAGASRTHDDLLNLAEQPVNRSALRECLEFRSTRRRYRGPETLVVRMRVDIDGDVLEGTVRSSTVRSADLVSCILETMMSWRFAAGVVENSFDVPVAIVPLDPLAQ